MRNCVSGMYEGLSSYFHVVEGNHTLAHLLVFLVALACDQDNVTSFGLVNGQLDGLPAVGLQSVADTSALQSGQSVIHDGNGIFASRIVAGEDDEVTSVPSRFAHEGPFGAVAVAAAAEHGDNASRSAALVQEIMRYGGEVPNGVVSVSI